MALDNTGDPTQNNAPPTDAAGPPPGSPSQPNRKQQIVDGIIVPAYQAILHRAPTQAEIDSDYDSYERNGGDVFRASLAQRAGSDGGDWFDQNKPGGVQPFGETYAAGTYTPGTFDEQFVAPTAESLTQDPGYQARSNELQRGFERGAAAKGSILGGGFIGRTLPRAQSEFASQEYGNAFQRAFDTYQQKYGMFSDTQARNADAFRTNETGKLNQYTTRYNSYQDLINNRRNYYNDQAQHELDLARLGLDATAQGHP